MKGDIVDNCAPHPPPPKKNEYKKLKQTEALGSSQLVTPYKMCSGLSWVS